MPTPHNTEAAATMTTAVLDHDAAGHEAHHSSLPIDNRKLAGRISRFGHGCRGWHK